MTDHDALDELNQALVAIDVILRNGKLDAARVSALAREARRSAERVNRNGLEPMQPPPGACGQAIRPVEIAGF
ncbi:hypothetical protein [Phreatobacter sp. AB_2022a]|uniref:hypothetical protein n=1 Tax=Phreatobacter sp. AB_2022a TaxID=3003134 RepID=UPI00056FA877|nr:hypothetical protein [Phreatobacter sp. AB_2022a]MCZ0737177.1 hypothetical protein [Phreatobacter sp. AB_2022a]CEJ11036.1 hypothetical protein BN1110_01322 [bacterium YEK0313]